MFKFQIIVCDDDHHKFIALKNQFNEQDFEFKYVAKVEELENYLSANSKPNAISLI